MSVFLGPGLDAPVYTVALACRGPGAISGHACFFGGVVWWSAGGG